MSVRKSIHKKRKLPEWLFSIKIRIIVPIMLIILLTGGFVLIGVSNTKTIRQLDTNFKTILSGQLASRAADVEKQLRSIKEHADRIASQINSQSVPVLNKLNKSENESYQINLPDSAVLNEIAAAHVLELTQMNSVSGAYIIWNGSASPDHGTYEGIYLIDYEPDQRAPANTDLQLAYGSAIWAAEQNIALAGSWSRYWGLRPGSDLDKPAFSIKLARIRSADYLKKNQLPSEAISAVSLAAWTEPYEAVGRSSRVITYLIPLLDTQHQVMALVGVEISEDSLLGWLPDVDSGFDTGSYLIALQKSELELQLTTELIKPKLRSFFKDQFALSEANQINLLLSPVDDNTRSFYTINLTEADTTDYYLTRQPLEMLSGDNSYSFRHRWVLAEMVQAGQLTSASSDLTERLVVLIILALCFALLIALMIGINLARPIQNLASYLLKHDPDTAVRLPRSGITEVDLLAESLEQMSDNLLEASFRTASIIDLVDMPIGSFEEQPEDDSVVVSSAVHELLDLDFKENIISRIPLSLWNEKLQSLLSHPESGYSDVYRWQAAQGESIKPGRWLRIKQAKSDGKISGILMDVTAEILEQKKLQRERDYDPLTGLLNRGAFVRLVEERLATVQEDREQFGLMLFIDLDNLKAINDGFGHQYGDQYLRMASSAIACCHNFDGLTARYAGDEFAIFLGTADNQEKLKQQLKAFLQHAETKKTELPDNTFMDLEMSIGAAWYPNHATSAADLLEYADFAMYQRKRRGKNGLTWFSKDDYVEAGKSKTLY